MCISLIKQRSTVEDGIYYQRWRHLLFGPSGGLSFFLDYRGVVYYYGEVVYQTKISSA